MKPLTLALPALLFAGLAALPTPARAETRRVVFEKTGGEQKWPLKEFDATLPADWSAFDFLVFEMRASSAQRFDLRLHTADAVRAVRLAPVAGAWVRAAVPLSFFTNKVRQGNDLAAVSNKLRPMMFINLSGTPGPIDAVREIGFLMPQPIGAPTLEIRSAKLAKEDPGDALLDGQPSVDEFGQWIHDDWPGKAKNLEQLKAAWAQEEKSFPAADSRYCRYGGFADTKAKATGYFRVEKIEGRWWFVDPDGHLFLSMGADCMGTASMTPTQGRDALFAQLPPADVAGGRGGARFGASFYTWNLVRRFGLDFTDKWVDSTLRRMAAWGFNTVGNWSDARLAASHRVPYVFTSRGWGIESGPMGIADVYAPDFAQAVDRSAAQQCDSRKEDPYLLGYFLGNEPPWPGREAEAAEAILRGPERPLQRELKAFLAAGDTPERRQAFLQQTYRKFVETVSAAVRKHDPNHLNLGLRFGSTAPPEIVRASGIFDVYSLNSYDVTPNPREIAKVKGLIDRPMLIGEFHFGVPGRGMTPGLRQTANQDERGAAYRYYVENAIADPAIVGTHWFEWIDEPNTGRFDGENYNIGMVDVTDLPYRELVEAARTTHRRLLAVHSGKQPPVTRQGKTQ